MSRSSTAIPSSRAASPAGSNSSSNRSPVRHPRVSDDDSSSTHTPARAPYESDVDSYTLRYGRSAPTPACPNPAPRRAPPAVSRPTRGRTTARISAGRRPTYQLAQRDFPWSTQEQGESSRAANHRPRPTTPPPASSHVPPPFHPIALVRPLPPPQPMVQPNVGGRLDSLQAGLRSAMDRLHQVDMSFIYWKEVLDGRTRDQSATEQTHRLEDRAEIARMRAMVQIFAGVAVVAVLVSVLPYFFPRY